jgi:hypothetical protein
LIVRRGAVQFCFVQFFFVGGTRRNYLIMNRLAGYRRPGGMRGVSLADMLKGTRIGDLRNPKDAAAMQKILATTALEDLGL